MHLSSGRKDMAIWKWSDNGQYSAASTYHMLCEGSICFLCAKPIWRCWAPLSCKIFLWLALQYRIWTFDRRLQHGLQDQSFVCFLCDQEEATADHILLQCMFSQQVWHYVSQGQRSIFRFLRWRIGLNLGGQPVGSFFRRSIVEVLTLWLLLSAGAYGNKGTEESSEGEISSMSGSLRLLFSKSSNFGLLHGRRECYHSVSSRLDL